MNRRRFFQMAAGLLGALAIPIPKLKPFLPYRTRQVTLLEIARMYPCEGQAKKIMGYLSERNPILDDLPWIEGNEGTGHEQA